MALEAAEPALDPAHRLDQEERDEAEDGAEDDREADELGAPEAAEPLVEGRARAPARRRRGARRCRRRGTGREPRTRSVRGRAPRSRRGRPEIGVPKTAAKPAPIPQITRRRRSSSFSRSTSAKRLVIAAPIWAQGPSFPTEPPKASVTTVARSLIGATFHGIRPDSRWIAAMTASVPWPRAVGANVRMRSTHAGSASGRSHTG